MKKYIFLLILFTTQNIYKSYSQNNRLYKNIEKIFTSAFVYNGGLIELEKYKNKAFTFGIAICINNNGVVDSILFTNKTKALDSLVSFERITNELKRDKLLFKDFKNTILVSIVLVRRNWDNCIDIIQGKKFDDQSDFDQNFYNILPKIEGVNAQRKIKLLPAFSLVQNKSKQ